MYLVPSIPVVKCPWAREIEFNKLTVTLFVHSALLKPKNRAMACKAMNGIRSKSSVILYQQVPIQFADH